MSNNITVITSNTNSKDGGYHEIHEIKYLNSPRHALETVKNILDLNLCYGDKEYPIVAMEIKCTEIETYNFIKEYYNHYNGLDDDIKVYVELIKKL